MIKKLFPVIFLFLTMVWMSCNKKLSNLSVQNLRCEYLDNPLGIDVTEPRLSWEITSPERGVMQTAYRILVASSEDLLKKDSGDLWNSGKITSDSTVGIKYAGEALQSRTDCYWKVKIWTNRGNEVESKPAHWSMGLLTPSAWSAKWTGLDSTFAWEAPHAPHTRLSARYFRKEFNTNKKIKKAVVYISGLGIYQLFINGEKVGDAELSPDPTQYNKRVFYNTYNVTDQLQKGENAIGTILGNGRYFAMRWGEISGLPDMMNFGYPRMLLQLEVTYEDGTVQRVVSDSTWKVTANGPVVANNEFDGEVYDATKEMSGWSKPGFEDSDLPAEAMSAEQARSAQAGWLQAQLVKAPGGQVEAQMSPLIKVMDTVKPKSVFQIGPDKYIVDMGQNMVGWAQIKIGNGVKGDTVTMRFAERITPDSSLYTANLRSAEQTDHYIMKEGKQEWEPHFTYHGFRFIEVTGYPGKPTTSDFIGKVVYDDLPTIGHFETSNEVINDVYHNAYWGIRGNYRGMPTDCPQRDERMGWLGDRAVGSYGESFIFDNNKLYAKWLQDIEDAQKESGSIPNVAPTYWRIYSDNMTWPGAYLTIANMLYHQFSNLKPIEQHYNSMKKWLSYMKDNYMEGYILYKDTYGDWCMPPKNPELIHSKLPERITAGAYLGTTFYYRMLQLMEHYATLLDKPEDKAAFKSLGTKIKKAFNEKYLNADASYSNNTATANIFALAYDLAPDSIRDEVFQHVVNTTMNDFNGHISTGLVGAQWLMRTLTRNGRPDIAYKLATNTTYPSWGYMVKEGATTIWELWNGNTANPAMNSGNHVMLLGDLIVWFYEDLAGIKSDSTQVGFKKVIMKPYHVVEGLDYVKSSYHSVHGLIESYWRKDKESFDWEITIPANTTARIYVPANSVEDISESGDGVNDAESVQFIKMEDGKAVFEIGSGSYHFVAKNFK